MKNLLSIQALSADEIREFVDLGALMKAERGHHTKHPLRHECWALIFNKSSTRTRVSFEVGIREFGGEVLFLSANEIQLGRGEPIRDTARVMGRMLHGAVIRTYAQSDVEEFAQFSGLRTINALTDEEHPCQILADLLTIQEKLGSIEERKVCYVGDGASNVARSWIWASERLGFELVIAAPEKHQPAVSLLSSLINGTVTCKEDLFEAAMHADILYTDVWVSMGQESESAQREAVLKSYRIDSKVVAEALPGALVMHCLPAYRGKEITEDVLEAHAQTIFDQAENRLHAQKAVLALLER
ncbi:MAG TPA: ornithine carbamoyltransferase [Chthoniobacterales bacterium]